MLQPHPVDHLFPQKKIFLSVKWQRGQHFDSACNLKEDSQQGTMCMDKTYIFLLLQIGILYHFIFKDINSFQCQGDKIKRSDSDSSTSRPTL
jgi:hypothetical protein